MPGRPCSPIADSAWPVYDEAGAAGWHRAPGYVRAECRAGVSVTHLLADAAARCRAPRPGAPAPRGARGCSGLPAPLSAGAHVPGWNLALRASCRWGSPGSWSQPPAPVRSAASCLPFSARWRNGPGGSAVVAEGGLVQRHRAGRRYLHGVQVRGYRVRLDLARRLRGCRADSVRTGGRLPRAWAAPRSRSMSGWISATWCGGCRFHCTDPRPRASGPLGTPVPASAELRFRAACPGYRRTARRQLAAALPGRLLRRLSRP